MAFGVGVSSSPRRDIFSCGKSVSLKRGKEYQARETVEIFQTLKGRQSMVAKFVFFGLGSEGAEEESHLCNKEGRVLPAHTNTPYTPEREEKKRRKWTKERAKNQFRCRISFINWFSGSVSVSVSSSIHCESLSLRGKLQVLR